MIQIRKNYFHWDRICNESIIIFIFWNLFINFSFCYLLLKKKDGIVIRITVTEVYAKWNIFFQKIFCGDGYCFRRAQIEGRHTKGWKKDYRYGTCFPGFREK